MALTRSMLKGMGLTEEQVGAIIDAHSETVDGLKADIAKYKKDAEALPGIQKELEALKQSDGGYKDKYDNEHRAFEEYKKSVTEKEKTAAVKAAYKKLLTDQKVGDKHIDAILKVTDFSEMKLGEDGKLADEANLIESIKTEWSGFIPTTTTNGANVSTPPAASTSTAKTKEEIMQIKDTRERQSAWANYIAEQQKG